MADITLAPVWIDPLNEATILVGQNPFYMGHFKIGTNLFAILAGGNVPLNRNRITAFVSTDQGATWTQCDAAGSPAFALGNTTRINAKLNGTVITISYDATVSTSLVFSTFDTVTRTFSSGVIPNLTIVGAGNNLLGSDFVYRANGDLVVFYSKIQAPNVSESDLVFSVLSGGVWGAINRVIAGVDATKTGYSVPAALIDPATDSIKLWFREIHLVIATSFDTDKFAEISNLDVVSGLQSLNVYAANQRLSYGRPQFWNGGLVLPVFETNGAGTTYTVDVYTSVGITAPVFTFTQLETGVNNDNTFDVAATQIIVDGLTLWVLWKRPLTTDVTIRRVQNTGSGFGPVTIFYDYVANPPNASGDVLIQDFTCDVIGSVGATIAVADPVDNLFTAYFLMQSAPPVVVVAGNPRMNMPGAVILPNPAIFCSAEKCDCPEFQSSKGVVGKYQ